MKENPYSEPLILEECLRQSETHLRLILDAAKIGTWEWDAQAGTIEADDFHQLLFGLPPQQGPPQ